MKKQKYYTIGMDINLMPACDIIGCNEKILKDIDYYELEKIIKEVQRNAIEVAVQRCNEEADFADFDAQWNSVLESWDYSGVVINSSILGCKQKLFEENNLI